MNVNSPDISVEQISVVFDLSGPNPIVTITNLSTANNPQNLTWWFTLVSPSGAPIHSGSFSTPDAVGAWTTHVLSDSWPRPMSNIEWSGAPYVLTVNFQDSTGKQYSDSSYTAAIQRPNGNTSLSKNFYGQGSTNLQVMCQQASIYFEDTTITSYYGITGTQLSNTLRVVYPLDPTYSIPTPGVYNFVSPVMVPISYSANGYQFLAQSVYQYQLSTYVFLNIQYQNLQSFNVLCNIDLMPLICEVQALVDSIENGSCSDVQEATRKLTLINPKFALAVMGIMQPLTGLDVAQLVQDIINIGGFTCDCCNAPTGIIPQNAAVINGYSFSVSKACGDISGTVTVNGTNIQFNLQDVTYIFNLASNIPTTAFSITPAVSGCVKTYTFNVNMVQFGTDLANTILSNAGLLNLWQTIFQGGSNFQLTVDGNCIFSSSATFNYTFTLTNIPTSGTFAILTGIQVGTVVQPLNYSFNIGNIAALQTYLNALNLGNFVVTNPSGNTVLITSNSNPNVLTAMTYKISGTVYIANLTSQASGYVPVSANYVVQQIINYICGLQDDDITTSQAYTLCYFSGGSQQSIIIPAGTSLAAFLEQLVTNECSTINYIDSLGAVNCATISAVFPTSANTMGPTDFVLGTKGGACARIGAVELGLDIMTLGSQNQNWLNAFCALVEQCASGQSCAPYTLLNAMLVPYSNTCPNVIGFTYNFTGSTINITNIQFANTPAAQQTVTILYEQQGQTSYTVYSNSVLVNPNGTPTAPISIGLTAGQIYSFEIYNNCGSPPVGFFQNITVPGNPLTVRLTSDTPGLSLTGVNGITGFTPTPAFPLNPGGTITGYHSTFTGVIQLVISGTPDVPPNCAVLYQNGVQIDCVNLSGTGTFSFGSHTFNSTDFIEIDLILAHC